MPIPFTTRFSKHLVLIELQNTWLITETLRFRQYLGTQYLNKENIIEQKMLCNNGASIDEISRQLSIPVEQIKQYIDS